MSIYVFDPTAHVGAGIDAATALRRLMEGNARYLGGRLEHGEQLAEQRSACAQEQHPFAAILGCSDARVPPQLVFDQGPGALFTIRVAGNVATDAVTGSIEYAVEKLGVPVVLVLGHSRCGAVSACLHGGVESTGGHLGVVLQAILPAVVRARQAEGEPLDNAIRFNVQHVVEQLQMLEPVLAPRVRRGELEIVGGLYDVDTGAVELLPSLPLEAGLV
jgi:carbonic anhydrase